MKATKIQFSKTSILLLSVLFFESCSSVKTNPLPSFVNIQPEVPVLELPKMSRVVRSSLPPQFENFDREPFANEAFVIANMISVVQPELNEEERDTIAAQISMAIKKYDIEPQIIVAIIDTESNFQSDKVSSTGDVSVGQINVEVWNKEFNRMKMPSMIKEKIKVDQSYALMKMAEILNIIKTRHGKTDRRWYARYHSNTFEHKNDYLHKLEIRLKMLATSNDLNNQIAQVKNLKVIAKSSSTDIITQIAETKNITHDLLTLFPMPTPTPNLTPQRLDSIETTDVIATLLLKDIYPSSVIK
ncbi:MAG: transglycosylase SLT domain-containing protein [Bacteriovorax sp.]|nr:transglycosylase SLT domain-containing protein [Bacteriovorax sp.]